MLLLWAKNQVKSKILVSKLFLVEKSRSTLSKLLFYRLKALPFLNFRVFSLSYNKNLHLNNEGNSTKKNSRKGKLNEKNSCTPINPRKYSSYGRKKIHSRNLTTKKKKSCGSKIPLPPPITFLMVRPLPTHIYIIQKLKNYHSLLHDKLEIDKAEWTKRKIHKTPLKPNYNIIQ